MKKVILFGLVCVFAVASNASASWFGDMLKRKSEPTTLSEACSSKEITAVCPETVLGEKTLSECMSENVKSLSRKCSKFVKKSIKENKELILENKEAATNALAEQVQNAKNEAAQKKAEKEAIKKQIAEKKAQLKADAKSTGKELKDAAKAVKTDAIETANSVKEIVK